MILLNIFKIIWWMNIIVGMGYNGSVWHIDWPYQVCVGQWPIFYGPAILLHILKTIWWIKFVLNESVSFKDRLCKIYVGQWSYFMVFWFCLIWTASSEFGTYHLCEQRTFRRTCAAAQSRQNFRCSLIQAYMLAHTSSESRGTFRQKARSLAPLNG